MVEFVHDKGRDEKKDPAKRNWKPKKAQKTRRRRRKPSRQQDDARQSQDKKQTPAAEAPKDSSKETSQPQKQKQREQDAKQQGDGKSQTSSRKRRRSRRRRKRTDDTSRGQQPKSEQQPKKSRDQSQKGRQPQKQDRSKEQGSREKKAEKQKKAWDPNSFQVAKKDGQTRFHDLDLPDEIMHAIDDLGFKYCTPIQADILPPTLKGLDAAGQAQTGTGKTAAFLITIFTHLLRNPVKGERRKGTPRALVIAPTRELAKQIEKEAAEIGKHTPFRSVVLYGGEKYAKQHELLKTDYVDVVVATPGRLLDCRNRRDVHLGHVEILILDEADRMLDMGFIPDVRKIIRSTPARKDRQTLLFSATLSPDVYKLASQWMEDPVKVEIEPEKVAVDSVDQKVFIVTTQKKFALLYNIIKLRNPKRVLVFANRRDTVQRIHDHLRDAGMHCGMLSGSMPQSKREKTLEAFRNGDISVVVATDVAGRGLHVEGIELVVNYNIPHDAEDYVHRIGRTGRAGAEGVSVSFACESDSFYIPDIEELMGRTLDCERPPEEWLEQPPEQRKRRRSSRRRGGRGRGGQRGKKQN